MWVKLLGWIAPYLGKYDLPVVCALCVFLLGRCWHLQNIGTDLEAEAANLKQRLLVLTEAYQEEQEKAQEVIEEQNSQIERFELDLEEYAGLVRQKERELLDSELRQRTELNLELGRDDSPENQLRIMLEKMKDFADETF